MTTPAGGWMIDLKPDRAGDWGVGDSGYGVNPGMTAKVPATVGGWTVNLLDVERKVIAIGHVTVSPASTCRS